jgi:hypothetical protein
MNNARGLLVRVCDEYLVPDDSFRVTYQAAFARALSQKMDREIMADLARYKRQAQRQRERRTRRNQFAKARLRQQGFYRNA